jgi:hypothetical protein
MIIHIFIKNPSKVVFLNDLWLEANWLKIKESVREITDSFIFDNGLVKPVARSLAIDNHVEGAEGLVIGIGYMYL